jgi:hypothetical protein
MVPDHEEIRDKLRKPKKRVDYSNKEFDTGTVTKQLPAATRMATAGA